MSDARAARTARAVNAFRLAGPRPGTAGRKGLGLARCPALAFVLGIAALANAPQAIAQSKVGPPPSAPTTSTPSSAPQARVHIYGQVYIGDRVPDFTLDGSDGKVVRPSRFRGDWLVMAFADRKEKLVQLSTIHEELTSLGVRVLGVCKEKAHNLQTYSTRQRLPIVMGADWTGEVSSLYGLYDSERSMITPGFLLVDREGIVRMALQGQNLPPQQIAALVRFAVTGL